MTEEEKKAIEYYSDKEVSFSVDFDTEKLLKALGITEEDSFENHQIRFKALLNLINKLQKANEEKDKTIKIRLDYEEAYAKLRKQYEELMSTNIIKNEEIKQKDKQIDLMAKYIDEIDVSEDICEGKTICDENCKYCIKQYFETKAKKGE